MTNISKAILIAVSVFTFSALADIAPIKNNADLTDVANRANDIFFVKTLKIGKFAYKVVGLDSKFNGDLSMTAIVLVGRGGVGGLAGYDQAFQVSPLDNMTLVTSARRVNRLLEIKGTNINGDKITKSFIYDEKTETLLEK